jgi:hypothetical protein
MKRPTSDLVPETAIDYDEVYRRGGHNFGNEHFALFKCPNCGHIYLLEHEVETAYLDPSDLSIRVNVFKDSLDCLNCSNRIPDNEPWIGPKARSEFGVTWPELKASRWAWIIGNSES